MSQVRLMYRARPVRLGMLLVLLLAAGLRFYHLPILPPGLNFDEAGSGVAALEILNGSPRLWWRLGGGQEPLWPYLVALSTTLWGNIPLALRLPAAWGGILTVAAAFRLVAGLPLGRSRRWLGLLAALGLALSEWHLHFSRLGFRAILLPLLATLAFWFLWQGLSRPRPAADIVLAALFTALAMYTYLAGRLLPLVPLLWLGLVRLRQWRRSEGGVRLSWLGMYGLALLLFLVPLIVYFSLNPADLLARSATVSIFNPAWHRGDLWGTAGRTLAATLGTFAGLAGDVNPLVNLPGRPALPPALALFFGLGLVVSLARLVRGRAGPALFSVRNSVGRASHAPPPGRGDVLAIVSHRVPASASLFLLSWWVVMLLPALLAPEGAPHHLRLLGTIIPTYALIAVGLGMAAELLARWLKPFPQVYLLPLVLYAGVGWQTCQGYFQRWPAEVDFTLPFDLYAVRLAGEIAAAPPEVGYVLPMDVRAGAEARHYTLDYLLAGHPAAYTYVPVESRQTPDLLNQVARGKSSLRVVRWTGDKHREADAKEIVTFLLARSARLVERHSEPVYDLETYVLAGPPALFALPPLDRPVGLTFDGQLRLEAIYLQPAAAPGEPLAVALALTPLAPPAADYKASLRLVGPAGERLAQKDRVLLHDYHQGTSLWPPGETVRSYYLLPLPPESPPGDYTVSLVIYHPDSLAPLPADNGLAEVPLGQVRVE